MAKEKMTLTDRLAVRLAGELTDWLAGFSQTGLADCMTSWLTDWLAGCTTGWFTHRLTDWRTDWRSGWLIS